MLGTNANDEEMSAVTKNNRSMAAQNLCVCEFWSKNKNISPASPYVYNTGVELCFISLDFSLLSSLLLPRNEENETC